MNCPNCQNLMTRTGAFPNSNSHTWICENCWHMEHTPKELEESALCEWCGMKMKRLQMSDGILRWYCDECAIWQIGRGVNSYG